jgi:hypothetical protein
VTESTTSFCSFTLTTPTSPLFSIIKTPETHSPFPASLSDSEWDGTSKVVTLKGRVGIQERHRNSIKKGEGRDGKKDFWDRYPYEQVFFYGVLFRPTAILYKTITGSIFSFFTFTLQYEIDRKTKRTLWDSVRLFFRKHGKSSLIMKGEKI